MVVVDT